MLSQSIVHSSWVTATLGTSLWSACLSQQLPPSRNSFFTWHLRCYSILILRTTVLFFLNLPAGSSSSSSWPLSFGVPWVLVSDHFPISAHSWDDLIHFQVYEGIPSVCWWPTFGCLIRHLRCNKSKTSFLSCFLNLHFLHGSSSQHHEWTRAR